MSKTVKEWIEFLNNENVVFGINARNKPYLLGIEHYLKGDKILQDKDWSNILNKKVVEAFVPTCIIDNTIYYLLEIESWD